ncbi:MAG: hypothetical protein KU37_06685 [Sulfuricurvum sp. PC08-66]|nr:MAG: hypothetical protein KU37_06685 [Sulfuricurvum sp. PC08-66]
MFLESAQDKKLFLQALQKRLDSSDEAPFWKEGIMPAAQIILDTLQRLQAQNRLLTPEGDALENLTFETFLRWFDLVNLRQLAFIIDEANTKSTLLGKPFEAIDLSELAHYLHSYQIDVGNPHADFPTRYYTKHKEFGNIIARLFGRPTPA